MSVQSTIASRPLVTEHEVARLLGIKVATVRRWRWAGTGPKFRKIGTCVRYLPEDLEAFIAASQRTSTRAP
jgi:predicted DNA-binding transcriptional regulator AlpA